MPTAILDNVTIVNTDEETKQPEQCNHFQHGRHESHGGGPAKFDVMFPCGASYKMCAHYVEWILAGNITECGARNGDFHDESNMVWVPL